MTTQPTSTLLNLVRTVNTCTDNDQEVVATVTYLINSGKVRLGGIFRRARINLSHLDNMVQQSSSGTDQPAAQG